MCRNIRTLYNFEPPATDDEIRAAALQYKEAAFYAAVDAVAAASRELLAALQTNAPPKDREVEAAKAKARAAERFGRL